MGKRNPLTISEIPKDQRKIFDVKNQDYHVTVMKGPRKGKRELCILRRCEDCGMERFLPVSEVRRHILRSGRGPSKCRECKYSGRVETSDGYIWILMPEHPKAISDGRYVLEHRLVMEKTLGRYLNDDESVHHINGVRSDNRAENLQLRQKYHGKGIVKRCGDCGSHNIESVPL
jgi:hypothetical protein